MFLLFLLLLVWVPIPIGSNRPWSLAILELCAMFLLGGWSLSYACRPFAIPETVRAARLPLGLLTVWALFPLLQLIPVPTALAGLIGAQANHLYAELPGEVSTGVAYLTLDRGATLAGFLKQLSLVAVLFAALALTTSVSRLRAVLTTMLIVGFAEALYGLVLHFGGEELGLWNPGHYPKTVSGTYVNQNHFAGLMEMSIAVGLGMLLAVRREHGHFSGSRAITRTLASFMLGREGVILFAILVMIAALLMTTSRGATGALAVGLATAVLVAVLTRGFGTREIRLGLVAVVLVPVAIVWLGTGGLSEKLQSAGLESNRGDLRELSYRMIGDNPVVGTGVGTFRWIFPKYKDERFGSGFYEHAHNDYLEILGEQGVVGFLLVAFAIIAIFIRLVRAYGQRRDPLMRGALFAAIAGGASLLTHGLVDFNFQIPANATYFFVLMAMGLVTTTIKHESFTGSRGA